MDISFYEITPDRVEDFLNFFNHSAFTPDDEWAGCYCLEGHCDRHFEISFTDREKRRKIAADLVKSGKLHGYILRNGDRDIGWVKLGDKINFDGFRDWPHGDFPERPGETAVLYCIDLIPEYRGKGIAKLILNKAIEIASAEGFTYLEAYPAADPSEHRNYRGHSGMYASAGFETVGAEDDFLIVRKKL